MSGAKNATAVISKANSPLTTRGFLLFNICTFVQCVFKNSAYTGSEVLNIIFEKGKFEHEETRPVFSPDDPRSYPVTLLACHRAGRSRCNGGTGRRIHR